MQWLDLRDFVGAGFIGSHLCEAFIEDGYEVVAMDNRVTGQTNNLNNVFYHDRFSFYEHDVAGFIHVAGDLDWVIHPGVSPRRSSIRTSPSRRSRSARYARDPRRYQKKTPSTSMPRRARCTATAK